jgi:pyruvate formate lyase activating enzyme
MATIPLVPPWVRNADGSVTVQRDAEFWRPLPDTRVACDLCYRRCELGDGEDGWCRYRGNRDGVMQIPEHGVTSQAVHDVTGHHPQDGGYFTFEPGAPVMLLGATYCTSSCSFCSSADLV